MNDDFLKLLGQIDELIRLKEYKSAKNLVDVALIKEMMNPELWRRKAIIFEKQHPKDRIHIKKYYEQAIAVGDVVESSKLLNRVVKEDNTKKRMQFLFVIVIWIAVVFTVVQNGGSSFIKVALNPATKLPTLTFTPTNTKTPIPTQTLIPSLTNTPLPSSTATQTTTKTPVTVYSRTNDQLAVRKGAGVEFDIITTLRIGDAPKVLGRNKDASWIKIKIGNDIKPIVGWIRILPEHVIVSGDLMDLDYVNQ